MKRLTIIVLLSAFACAQDTVISGSTTLAMAGTSSCYKRYSGFCQTAPLSDEDKKLDAAYESIDKTFSKLGNEPMAYITINEYLEVVHISDKLPWYDKAESVYSAERQLREIMQKVESRRAEAGQTREPHE